MPDIRAQRIGTARRKMLQVLRFRHVCHQKELERRVCEVGFKFYPLAPQEDRPEPVHLNEARKQLILDGRVAPPTPRQIRNNQHNFYSLRDADPDIVAATLEEKVAATRVYEQIQGAAHLSGFLAERMLHKAMVESKAFFVLSLETGRDITGFNGLTTDRGVDLAGMDLGSHLAVVIQVKNIREWVYPDSDVMWTLLASAAQLNAVPVIIARRIAEPTYLFMNDLGGYAFPMMKNYISSEIENDGRSDAFLNAAATLGYRDVELIDPSVPIPRFVEFFKSRLPARVEEMARLFLPRVERVLEVAIGEGLRDDDIRTGRQSGEPRDAIFSGFWRELRGGEEVEEWASQ